MSVSILIIEDEPDIQEMIKEALSSFEYQLYLASDGREAIDRFQSMEAIDLVLLDLMLPKMDGMAVLKKIRQKSTVPILILSAKNGEYEKALGLEYGADDYLTKPFSVIELQARVKAQLRRANEYHRKNPVQTDLITVGFLTLDPENLLIKKDDSPLSLTAKEYEVLKLFLTHPNKIYTKVQLYEAVWDEDFLHDENVINVTIRRLRQKIEDDPSAPKIIKTVWGIGYKLGIEEES